MPYVNIPKSQLVGGVARIVGKLQGEISSKIVEKGSEISSKFRRQGCPTSSATQRLRKQTEGLQNGIQNVKGRIEQFNKLPSKLQGPLSGLKTALKVILTLPIPQSVPPGFGLPISITTKYADVLHLIKEFVAQIEEDIEGIKAVTSTPSLFLSNTERILSRIDGAIKSCETEAALRDQVERGNISEDELKNIGLIDEDEVYIFSKLGPIFLGNTSIDNNGSLTNTSSINSSLIQNRNLLDAIGVDISTLPIDIQNVLLQDITGKSSSSNLTLQQDIPTERLSSEQLSQRDNTFKRLSADQEDILNQVAQNKLNSSLTALEKSNIDRDTLNRLRELFSLLIVPNKRSVSEDTRFTHTGPNGEVYTLEIVQDELGSTLAPRNYAIAKDAEGTIVLKGPKSFSSSTDILLKEIKFRIDNQLP